MANVIWNEIYKLLARKKIYIFAVILIVVCLFSLCSALITNSIFKSASPHANADMQSQVMYALGKINGQSIPLAMFDGITSSIILPVFIIILITDMVTDEYAEGTLKLPLLRQVGRYELLSSKLGALAVILMLMLLLMLIMGYGLGTAIFGWGDAFLIRGRGLSSSQGLLFTLLVYGSSLISMISFGMVILMFSVLFNNSGTVVGIGMAALFSSTMFGAVFPEVNSYLLSGYFNTYRFFTSYTGIEEIASGFLIVLTYGIVSLILSLLVFKRKNLLT